MKNVSDRKEGAILFAMYSYLRVMHSPITCSSRNGSTCFPKVTLSELITESFSLPSQHSHLSLQHPLLLQAPKFQSTLTDLHWRPPGLTCNLPPAVCRNAEWGSIIGLQILSPGLQAHSLAASTYCHFILGHWGQLIQLFNLWHHVPTGCSHSNQILSPLPGKNLKKPQTPALPIKNLSEGRQQGYV